MKYFSYIPVVLFFTQMLPAQILWHKTPFPDTLWVATLSAGPNDEILAGSRGLYGGSSGYGIFKSSNGGTTWQSANGGILSRFSAVSLNRVDDGTVYCASSVGLFKTTDYGSTWTQLIVNAVSSFGFLAINKNHDLFAGATGGIYRSLDHGQQWKKIFFSGDETIITISVDSLGSIFSPAAAGVNRSLDNGNSWVRLGDLTTTQGNTTIVHHVRSSAISLDGTLLLGTSDGGIYRSSDRGSTLLQSRTGMGTIGVSAIFINKDGSLFAGTRTGKIFLSTNDGLSWNSITEDRMAASVEAFSMDPQGFLYVGTWNGGIFRSHRSLTSFVPDSRDISFRGWPGLVYSHRHRIQNASPDTLKIYQTATTNTVFTVHPNAGVVFPGGYQDFEVFYSPAKIGTDTGQVWFTNDSFLPIRSVRLEGLSGVPNLRLPFRTLSFEFPVVGSPVDSSFAISNDGADTLRIDSISSTRSSYLIIVDSNLIAPNESTYVRVTYNPQLSIQSGELIITSNNSSSPDTIRLRGGGVAPSDISLEPFQQSTFLLSQNFPNPFNSITQIEYSLPSVADIRINILDILGREIIVLVDEKTYPGTHRIEWDATGVPSGVYFCRILAGEFVQTRKLILAK